MRTETATRNGRPCRVTHQGNEEVREYLDGSDFNSGIRFGANFAGQMVYSEAPTRPSVPIKVHPPNTRTEATPPIPTRSTSELSDMTIILRDRALDTMRHSTLWGTGMDGKETGGWLLGYTDGDRIVITNATESVSRRDEESCTLDFSDAKEADRYAKQGAGEPWAGMWHVHPSDSPEPSQTDYRSLEEAIQMKDMSHYVGLIVTPSEGSFARPTVHGFITSRNGASIHTQPAYVTQDDE